MLDEIPWAGIGAFMAGAGSVLSGYAALKIARREKEPAQGEGENPNEDAKA